MLEFRNSYNFGIDFLLSGLFLSFWVVVCLLVDKLSFLFLFYFKLFYLFRIMVLCFKVRMFFELFVVVRRFMVYVKNVYYSFIYKIL